MSLAAGAVGVAGIARIGASGKAWKNCARDLKRLVHKQTSAPLPYIVRIPITDPKTNKQEYVDHPVLLPHEMIAYIVARGLARVEELADVGTRSDQRLQEHKRNFCAKHGCLRELVFLLGFMEMVFPTRVNPQKLHH